MIAIAAVIAYLIGMAYMSHRIRRIERYYRVQAKERQPR